MGEPSTTASFFSPQSRNQPSLFSLFFCWNWPALILLLFSLFYPRITLAPFVARGLCSSSSFPLSYWSLFFSLSLDHSRQFYSSSLLFLNSPPDQPIHKSSMAIYSQDCSMNLLLACCMKLGWWENAVGWLVGAWVLLACWNCLLCC